MTKAARGCAAIIQSRQPFLRTGLGLPHTGHSMTRAERRATPMPPPVRLDPWQGERDGGRRMDLVVAFTVILRFSWWLGLASRFGGGVAVPCGKVDGRFGKGARRMRNHSSSFVKAAVSFGKPSFHSDDACVCFGSASLPPGRASCILGQDSRSFGRRLFLVGGASLRTGRARFILCNVPGMVGSESLVVG
jgi:hypothetical protein